MNLRRNKSKIDCPETNRVGVWRGRGKSFQDTTSQITTHDGFFRSRLSVGHNGNKSYSYSNNRNSAKRVTQVVEGGMLEQQQQPPLQLGDMQ